MSTPYLIQRMEFKSPQDRRQPDVSFDGLLEMDYMGSAEFEFGSLPTALKQLTRNHAKLVIEVAGEGRFDRNEAGERMLLIGTPEASGRLPAVHERPVRQGQTPPEGRNLSQHRRCAAASRVHVRRSWARTVSAWWDINKHVIFCFGLRNADSHRHGLSGSFGPAKKKTARPIGWVDKHRVLCDKTSKT
jgi:hypothetical protein